jgi:hypothetical protein
MRFASKLLTVAISFAALSPALAERSFESQTICRTAIAFDCRARLYQHFGNKYGPTNSASAARIERGPSDPSLIAHYANAIRAVCVARQLKAGSSYRSAISNAATMTHGDVPNVVPCTFSLGNPRVARTFQGLLELMQINSKRGEVVHCGAGFANFGFEFAEMIRRIVCALAFTLITQAHATSPAEQRGKTFALTNCAR